MGYTPQLLTVDRTLPLDVQRFLAMSGISDTEILQETLTSVGASAIFNQEIRLLSGGELKRVMLARALLREPDLLVLDEPTANVDVHGQTEFYELIRKIRDERGCGILLASHDLHLVMSATDRVVCLNGMYAVPVCRMPLSGSGLSRTVRRGRFGRCVLFARPRP